MSSFLRTKNRCFLTSLYTLLYLDKIQITAQVTTEDTEEQVDINKGCTIRYIPLCTPAYRQAGVE
jgi:hypothetical protein